MANNWQNRVKNHEETPPKGVWEAIAKELDQQDNITKKAPIVKMVYLKWAIAASIFLGLVSTIVYLNNNNAKTIIVAKKDTVKPTIETSKTIVPPPNNLIDKEVVIASVKKSSTTIKSTNSRITNSTEPAVVDEYDIDIDNQITPVILENPNKNIANPIANNREKLKTIGGEIINDISLMEAPNSYMSFIGPNGQEIRVSSKFSNIIGSLNSENEEYLDKLINESAFWKEKFKAWRDKMSNNTIAQSPSNFMDIVELSNILNEEK